MSEAKNEFSRERARVWRLNNPEKMARRERRKKRLSLRERKSAAIWAKLSSKERKRRKDRGKKISESKTANSQYKIEMERLKDLKNPRRVTLRIEREFKKEFRAIGKVPNTEHVETMVQRLAGKHPSRLQLLERIYMISDLGVLLAPERKLLLQIAVNAVRKSIAYENTNHREIL